LEVPYARGDFRSHDKASAVPRRRFPSKSTLLQFIEK
jgi:hypothetical protein